MYDYNSYCGLIMPVQRRATIHSIFAVTAINKADAASPARGCPIGLDGPPVCGGLVGLARFQTSQAHKGCCALYGPERMIFSLS